MSEPKPCPECGKVLPRDAPKGFCPACLVRLGIGWGEMPSAEGRVRKAELPVSFGEYELLREIGRGGMGVVYKARQIALNRLVAVKMLLHGRFHDPAFVERFYLEAEAAGHLDHPNIVPIYEVGQHEGQPFYSMRWIEGRSLAQANAECGIRGAEWLRRSAELVAMIAGAVHYAHERGVLHRDLKPHNILLDNQGHPYLTDFGLAKLLGQESGLTLSAGLIGSPEFMAPEQAGGKTCQITTAADVYGLGAVLYALLTGKAVFHADTPVETVRQLLEREPVRPQTLNPVVDRDLETICLKCLQKEPARRYASAQALAEDLECWLRAEPIQARPATGIEKAGLWCRRQPVRAGLIGALVLVFALGLGGVVWQWHRAKAGELFARQNAYAADINLAQRALADHDFGHVIRLLDKYGHHDKADPDLRGWEWRYLRRLCQSEESFTLCRYSEGVGQLGSSQDGKWLAVQTGNRAILWDFPARRADFEFTNVSPGALAISPARNLVAISTMSGPGAPGIRVWNADTRRFDATLPCDAPPRLLVWSRDGALLATLDQRANIQVRSWSDGQVLARRTLPPLRRGGVGALAFRPDASTLAIGGDAGLLELMDWHSQEVESLETRSGDGVTAVAFSPDGETLAAGFGFSTRAIRLWDMRSRRERGSLTNHTGYVRTLVFATDGRLVSAGTDGTIRVWSLSEMAELRRFQAPRHSPETLALLPDGRTLAGGAGDGTVCIWDLQSTSAADAHVSLPISYGMEIKLDSRAASYERGNPDPEVVRRFAVAYAPDSRSFVTSDRDGFLTSYDARSLQVRESLYSWGSNHWAVAQSPDGQWIAAGEASGSIRIRSAKTRVAAANLFVPFEWFGRLRFSPSGRYLLANVFLKDQSQVFKLWQTNGWAEVPLSPAMVVGSFSAALSPDDKLLAVGYTSGVVRLWEFPSTKRSWELKQHTRRIYDVRFSPNGRLLASAGDDAAVLWDVGTRRLVTVLPGVSRAVWGVVFSPDSRRLATGGSVSIDAVKLWDIVTQRELLTLSPEGTYFAEVSFSPDGNILQASSFSGEAHLWRAPSWPEIEDWEKQPSP